MYVLEFEFKLEGIRFVAFYNIICFQTLVYFILLFFLKTF